jgi:hypothetical protein
VIGTHNGTSTQRQQWRQLVATLEDSLRLHRHKPGALIALDAYLYERTNGAIGSLSQLIRGAATEAILSGTETVTRKTLDLIEVDQSAQAAHDRRRRTRRPQRSHDADAA